MDPEEDQSHLMVVIEPLLLGLHTVLYDAVAKYLGEDYSDAARAEHSDRTVANIIYDHADRGWRHLEETVPGCVFRNTRGMHTLIYQDQAVLRLKQVDGDGRHANYQTDQQRDYDDDLPIPGLPVSAARLYAGYQMDEAGMGIERVMIVRQLGRDIIWSAQVNVMDESVSWADITPRRFTGMGRTDFDAARARRGRR